MNYNNKTILLLIADEAEKRMRTGKYANEAQAIYEVFGEIAQCVIGLLQEANEKERITDQ